MQLRHGARQYAALLAEGQERGRSRRRCPGPDEVERRSEPIGIVGFDQAAAFGAISKRLRQKVCDDERAYKTFSIVPRFGAAERPDRGSAPGEGDRKSTRLNSSH